jgi:hypothetical protein
VKLLDAAFPPPPDQLVADCGSVRADGCWAYAWGPFTNYTPAHAQALHAAGLVCPAIWVPGNRPGSFGRMLQAAVALGCDPVGAFDIEAGSLPPAGWVADAITFVRAAGWSPRRYGDQVLLVSSYPAADGDWISHFEGNSPRVQAGCTDPVIVPGFAWQGCVNTQINGHEYDVSSVDPAWWGTSTFPPIPPLPPVVQAYIAGRSS